MDPKRVVYTRHITAKGMPGFPTRFHYHQKCRHLRSAAARATNPDVVTVDMTLGDALKEGFTPCSNCASDATPAK